MPVVDPFSQALARFRQDAARWVRPEQLADPDEVSPLVVARLLVRHPPLRAMAWFRLAVAARDAGVRGVPALVQRRLLSVYGRELAPHTDVGGGLYVAHPVGCVLYADRIGENVSVIGSVTFGTRRDGGWPVIESGAFIGVGARILGPITIGEGAQVGANAVVLKDVAPGVTVVGIPARPLTPVLSPR